MIWQGCTQTTNHSKIKLSDPRSKRHAIFSNPNNEDYLKTAADGCWKKQEICADWVLTSETHNTQAIVELKGSDVAHAIEQVVATANALEKEGKKANIIAGLVICTQYPSVDTKIQRGRLSFKKRFNAPIHVVTKSQEFHLAKVVKFDGPL